MGVYLNPAQKFVNLSLQLGLSLYRVINRHHFCGSSKRCHADPGNKLLDDFVSLPFCSVGCLAGDHLQFQNLRILYLNQPAREKLCHFLLINGLCV